MTNEVAIHNLFVLKLRSKLTSDKEALDMAIKALEQQPCEDCISRESLRQKLQEHHDFFVNAYGNFRGMSLSDKIRVDEITNCIAMVVNEPSVTPSYNSIKTELEQTRWIPVSERLPEESGIYLVSMYRWGYPQREVDGFVCGRWERFGNDVIAWREIPEPYKAESEE